jgi:hypothetical protein
MLAQTLRWRNGATEERFLTIEKKRKDPYTDDCGKLQYGMMISGETYDDVHDMIRRLERLELRWGAAIQVIGLAGP